MPRQKWLQVNQLGLNLLPPYPKLDKEKCDIKTWTFTPSLPQVNGTKEHIRFVDLQSILGKFSSYDTLIERKCKKNVIKMAVDRQIFEKYI